MIARARFVPAASLATAVLTAVLSALSLGSAARPAIAASADAAYAACMRSAPSTLAIETCQKSELTRVEAALAAAYAKALAGLPPDQRAKLHNAETQWQTFRASDCGAFYGSETGTMAGIQAGTCLVRRAQDRTIELGDFKPPGK